MPRTPPQAAPSHRPYATCKLFFTSRFLPPGDENCSTLQSINVPPLVPPALEAKARRLGISVEEARELDEQRVLADDPRKGSASKIEADYGKRSGQYAWQRNKEEVKRKAEEAKARAASGGTRAAEEHAESAKQDVALEEADLSRAVSVPVLLLKFDEPRSWYQKPSWLSVGPLKSRSSTYTVSKSLDPSNQ